MALLQASGTTIRFSDIRGMYGGNASEVRISEYFKGKTRVPDAPSSSTIPVEGTAATKNEIRFSKFYGTAKEYVITVAANATNYNWETAFAAAFPSPTRSTDYIARLIVNSGVTIGATATSSYALTVGTFPTAARLYIDNYGSIRGAGGAGASLADGDGLSGGPAVNADVAQTTTITVKSGGSVYGGGGGGGKGGRGGTGGKGGDGTYTAEDEKFYRNSPFPFTGDYFCIKGYISGVWAYTNFKWAGVGVGGVSSRFGQSESQTVIYYLGIPYKLGTYQSIAIGSEYYYSIIKQTPNTTSTGGTGGTGGAGGNGGRGAGYNQTVANGDGGSTGSAGNAGGTNAGTGGTGGTGGSGGNGGGLGSAGFSGGTGNQGATGGGGGATGASGVSGTTAGSAGRSVFKNGRSTVTVTVESGAAILPAAA